MAATSAARPGERAARMLELLRWIGPLAALLVLALAALVLHHEFARLSPADVLAHLRRIPRTHLLTALALTIASYALISGYDVLALRYVRKHLHYGRVVFTAFVAAVFGHNLGFSALTGGAVRLRLYAATAISAIEVAAITVFYSVSIALGLTCIAGLSLTFSPAFAAAALQVPARWCERAGVALLLAVCAYLLWAGLSQRAIEIRGWALRAPGFALGAAQTLLSMIDLSVEGAVLWWLLPPSAHIGLVPFMGSYVIALSAGILSHVPGGLGVFETVMLLALRAAPAASVLGALLAFRAVYYLAPLLIGAALFGWQEIRSRGGELARARAHAATYVTPLAPQIAGSLVFLAGALLVIGALWPPLALRVPLLQRLLPETLPRLAGLAASLAGGALMLLARALFRRVRFAYWLTWRLLVVAIAISAAQGLLIEQAPLLGLVLMVLWLGRDAFYRPSAVLDERFTPAWLGAVGGVLVLGAWLSLLMQHGASHAAAARNLKAVLPASVLAIVYIAINLLRPAPPEPAEASEADLTRAERVIAHSAQSLANAALSGDKRLLFAETAAAFLAYQVIGRSWIALGDPVGERAGGEELLWRFCQIAERHGGQPVFFQAASAWLSAYEDLGLLALPIGALARVRLEHLSLLGDSRAGLRHALQHAHRAGLSFEAVAAPAPAPLLSTLQNVAHAWLARHATGERRFAAGHCSASYLRHFPLALIRRGGEPIAFATLWPAGDREEIAFDLIRVLPQAPIGTTSDLLIETLLWARTQGYRWANLGLVPLADRPGVLALPWQQAERLVFTHGEHFERLEQMRPYFERFEPHWETRYLLTHSDIALPRVLRDLVRLIGAGWARRRHARDPGATANL